MMATTRVRTSLASVSPPPPVRDAGSLESLQREPEVLGVGVPVRPPQRIVGIAEAGPEAQHQGLFALGFCRPRGASDDRHDVRGDLAPLCGGVGWLAWSPARQVAHRRLE